MATETLDLTPTPAEYVNLLNMIVNNSTRRADRAFAMAEILRVQPAVGTGKWSK